MGQHKTNPNSIAKAKGELKPEKRHPRLTQRDVNDLLFAKMMERTLERRTKMAGYPRKVVALSAQDYINKYGDRLNASNDLDKLATTVSEVISEMGVEVHTACTASGMTSDQDVVWMLEAQNLKWNEFADLFNKASGINILSQNSFLNVMKAKMPEDIGLFK